MSQLVYYSTGNYNNGNSIWFDNLLRTNNKKLQFIACTALAALSIYVLTPSLSTLLFKKSDKDMFSSSKRSDKYTTGLINNRNDCFANSSVQALSSLPKLTLYLNDILKQAQFLRNLLDNNKHDGLKDLNLGSEPQSAKQEADTEPEPRAKPHPLDNNPDLATHLNVSRPVFSNFSSTATITTLSLARSGGDEEGPLADTVQNSPAGEEVAEGQESSENNQNSTFATATTDQIPEIPMHEGLAQILYQLQQTVVSKTYISVWPFLHVIELIFDARISTGQNDAHELTQVILETLEKENIKLKKFVKDQSLNVIIPDFPVRGSLADHLVCLNCRDSSKVNVHPFSMYPLPVPQESTAILADMISDNQTETIEGYSCLSCKIRAILSNEKQRNFAGTSESERNVLQTLEKILPDIFINDDLSAELTTYIDNYNKDGVNTSILKSTIVKKTVVVDSPELLIIHLSRSVFNGMNYTRNSCNVAFEEDLGLQEQIIEKNKCVGVNNVKYRLRATVRHQGTHSAGHYECYRHKPDFVKDVGSGEVINRTPVVDFGMDSSRMAADVYNQAASASNQSDVSSISSQESELSSNVPFRTVFPETGATVARSNSTGDDDYVVGTEPPSSSSNAPSRKPSTLKKITGFISRRSSVASTASDSDSTNAFIDSTASQTSSSQNGGFRSRVNSIASLKMERKQSVDSTAISSSGTEFTATSASETDDPATNGSTIKRRLKKLKSALKYPYWRISDAQVKEAKSGEVLGETKYVYMMYYERVN